MEAVSFIAGAAAAFVTFILALTVLVSKYRNWQKELNREVLIETGLVRWSDPGEPPHAIWPNSYDTLPEAIEGIDNRTRKLESYHQD